MARVTQEDNAKGKLSKDAEKALRREAAGFVRTLGWDSLNVFLNVKMLEIVEQAKRQVTAQKT